MPQYPLAVQALAANPSLRKAPASPFLMPGTQSSDPSMERYALASQFKDEADDRRVQALKALQPGVGAAWGAQSVSHQGDMDQAMGAMTNAPMMARYKADIAAQTEGFPDARSMQESASQIAHEKINAPIRQQEVQNTGLLQAAQEHSFGSLQTVREQNKGYRDLQREGQDYLGQREDESRNFIKDLQKMGQEGGQSGGEVVGYTPPGLKTAGSYRFAPDQKPASTAVYDRALVDAPAPTRGQSIFEDPYRGPAASALIAQSKLSPDWKQSVIDALKSPEHMDSPEDDIFNQPNQFTEPDEYDNYVNAVNLIRRLRGVR